MRLYGAALAVALTSTSAIAAKPVTIFKHVIIVFQENRTPDNLFASNPRFERGVDIQATGTDSHGQSVALTALPMADCYDPHHGQTAFQEAYTKGADQVEDDLEPGCTLPPNPNFKFVDNTTGEVQPYFDIATSYGFANRMFQTNQGPSFPAHQFIFSGTSSPSTDSPLFAASNMNVKSELAGCIAPADQNISLIDGYGSTRTNAPIYPCFEHPTMGDLLNTAHISWRYYSSAPGGIWTAPNAIRHTCAPALTGTALTCQGPDWTNGNVVTGNPAQVLTDIQNCKLPAVAWAIPGGAESDHANITDGSGPQWVAGIVNAVGQQPTCASGENYWKDTAIVITWDDWGGWYDHVKPGKVNVQPTSPPAWGDGYTYGFRVPMMVVSAFTPAGYVDNAPHDFGSILNFIEKNFRLGYIGPGTTIYSNYADYQDGVRGDNMANFFSLPSPRPFVPIATTMSISHFRNLPPSTLPPDDE